MSQKFTWLLHLLRRFVSVKYRLKVAGGACTGLTRWRKGGRRVIGRPSMGNSPVPSNRAGHIQVKTLFSLPCALAVFELQKKLWYLSYESALYVTMGQCRSDTPTFCLFTQSNTRGVLRLVLRWQDFENFHYSQTSHFGKLSKNIIYLARLTN